MTHEEIDAILKGVLEEYVWRRDGIIGSANPEWFRHFLGERGYTLELIPETEPTGSKAGTEGL